MQSNDLKPTETPARVLDSDGQQIGTYQRSAETPDGPMLLIERDCRFGGGTIVVPEKEAGEPEHGDWG